MLLFVFNLYKLKLRSKKKYNNTVVYINCSFNFGIVVVG